MKLVTYNLRCAWDNDGINSFIHRGGMILQKIRTEKPDILGFQEGVEQSISFLRANLPEYTILFNQRNTDLHGEGLAIAYRTEALELLSMDFFWLSETPYAPGSRYTKQSLCPRICQAALFREKNSARIFRVLNNHLDHISDEARILGIHQVLEYAVSLQDKLSAPFFILGDFNAEPNSGVIRYCDTFEPLPIRDLTRAVGPTFHDFGRLETPVKIDYIYADAKTAALPCRAVRWTDELHGIYLSDHYPVCLELDWTSD